MALKPLNVGDTWPFTSEFDPDKGDPKKATVFTLCVLDSYIMGRVSDLMTEFEADPGGDRERTKTRLNISIAAAEACRFGIVGITNFLDKDGKELFAREPVQLPGNRRYEVVREDVLARIEAPILQEVFVELRDRNSITKEEEKNSDRSSSPSNSSQSGDATVAQRSKSEGGAATPA